jgi:AcrR family transcriptional regulator
MRAKLLAAARQVFARQGYHEASIAEITTLADVAVGTFYLYFRDKDEAFQLVLQGGARETLAEIKQAIAVAPEGPSLAVVVRAILTHAYVQRDLFRVALMAEGQFKRMTHVQELIEEVLTTALNEDTAGVVSSYMPLLVRFLSGMLLQGIMWWFEDDQPGPDEMTDHMLALLEHGLPAQVIHGPHHDEG